jgi:hypothetical protein
MIVPCNAGEFQSEEHLRGCVVQCPTEVIMILADGMTVMKASVKIACSLRRKRRRGRGR